MSKNIRMIFPAHLQLGALALARLDAAGATSALAVAVRTKPEDPIAHNLYGSALQTLGRSPEALAQFQIAVRLKGDFVNARYNLARALIKAGRLGSSHRKSARGGCGVSEMTRRRTSIWRRRLPFGHGRSDAQRKGLLSCPLFKSSE